MLHKPTFRLLLSLAFVSQCGPYKSHALVPDSIRRPTPYTYEIQPKDVTLFQYYAKCGGTIPLAEGRDYMPILAECEVWYAQCLEAFETYNETARERPDEELASYIIDTLECFEY